MYSETTTLKVAFPSKKKPLSATLQRARELWNRPGLARTLEELEAEADAEAIRREQKQFPITDRV